MSAHGHSAFLSEVRAMTRRVTPVGLRRRAHRGLLRLLESTDPAVHFLHIGKTGGTAIKHALADVRETDVGRLFLHPHSTALWDVPKTHSVFFVVRDPVDRFCSAFWSRQRQGRPRYDSPWTADEARAFSRFASPNELATALGATDTVERNAAIAAMGSIGHVRERLSDWLGSPTLVRQRSDRILWVGRQDVLDEDFAALCRVLGVEVALPIGDVDAHRNPPGVDRTLDPEARRNIQLWYSSDYSLLDACAALVGNEST